MRIGLVIDTFNLGGAETLVCELARVFKSRGYTPVLLHFGNPYLEKFCKEEEVEGHLIPHRKFYKKTLLLPIFAILVAPFLRGLKLDCLHTHLFGPIVAFAPAAVFARLHHVGTLHDVHMIEDAPKRIWLIRLSRLFKTQLVAVSRAMQRFYMERGGFDQSQVVYVPNFSKIPEIENDREKKRASLGLAGDDIVFISVGRLVRLKRFDLLVETMATPAMLGKATLLIVGDGPERAALEDLIRSKNLGQQVQLLGERSDVPELLAMADVFSLVSETEGMSKSILEALAAGLPVVATNVGGNGDLVIDGENGYLVEEHNALEISQKFDLLIENEPQRLAMGAASKQLIEKEFNENKFYENHLSLYKNEFKS